MIQRKLADMATRSLRRRQHELPTAGLMDAAASAWTVGGRLRERLVRESVEEYTIEASILKVFGTETLDFVADESLQILGGYGFTAEYPVRAAIPRRAHQPHLRGHETRSTRSSSRRRW